MFYIYRYDVWVGLIVGPVVQLYVKDKGVNCDGGGIRRVLGWLVGYDGGI